MGISILVHSQIHPDLALSSLSERLRFAALYPYNNKPAILAPRNPLPKYLLEKAPFPIYLPVPPSHSPWRRFRLSLMSLYCCSHIVVM